MINTAALAFAEQIRIRKSYPWLNAALTAFAPYSHHHNCYCNDCKEVRHRNRLWVQHFNRRGLK